MPQLLNVTEKAEVQGMYTAKDNLLLSPDQLKEELSQFLNGVPIVEVVPANLQ